MIINKDYWLVATNEEGILLTTDDFEEALTEYEKQIGDYKNYVNDNGYFFGCEDVILAKIQRRLSVIEVEENSMMQWQEDNLF